MKTRQNLVPWIFAVLLATITVKCGDTVTQFLDAYETSQARNIKLMVSGLLGSGFRVGLNGEILSITANGKNLFSLKVRKGENYHVLVLQHPTAPNQYCQIGNAAGVVGNDDVALNAHCLPGSAAGEMVSGNIMKELNLSGDADVLYSEYFAGQLGAPGTGDGIGNIAQFTNVTQLATDGVHIYALESTIAGALRRINIATREVATLGNIGGTDGIATDGIHVFATNFTNCTIRKMNLATLSVSVVAGQTGACAFADAPSGPGSSARFNNPVALAFDGTHLYVTDYGNHRIRRVDPSTGATITIAGTGIASSINNPGGTATFQFPHGLLYFGGRLYVTEATFHAVRSIDLANPQYTVATFAGTGGFGYLDGPAGIAEFKLLRHLATDGKFLYATDKGSNRIRKISLSTGEVSTVSGSGGTTTSIGSAGIAGFRHPFGIVAAGTHLFVTDYDDSILRRIE